MPRSRLSPEERARRLERLQADYEAAKARLEPIGFICEGSLVDVYHCCHKPNCRCADPDQRHGPYRQLSWKEGGKTVSVRLSEEEARLYREWITNRRALDAVIAEMRSVSREAAEHLLAEIGHSYDGPKRTGQRSTSGSRRDA